MFIYRAQLLLEQWFCFEHHHGLCMQESPSLVPQGSLLPACARCCGSQVWEGLRAPAVLWAWLCVPRLTELSLRAPRHREHTDLHTADILGSHWRPVALTRFSSWSPGNVAFEKLRVVFFVSDILVVLRLRGGKYSISVSLMQIID